jgi:hypothetical protein
MDLIAEYAEFKEIPAHVAVAYKFFSTFRLEGATLWWGGYSCPVREEAYSGVKTFLKEQKRTIREGGLSKSECSRRMWFWVQKIIDLGLFHTVPEARTEIFKWLEVCELVLF